MLLYAITYSLPDMMGEKKNLNQYGQSNQDRSLWTVDDLKNFKYGESGTQKMTVYMNKLKILLDKHKVKLTLEVYPWPDQILHQDLDSCHVKHWKEWRQKNNCDFINHFPAFINNQDKEKILKEYFIESDVHWNAKGHQLIAEQFLRHYAKRDTQSFVGEK